MPARLGRDSSSLQMAFALSAMALLQQSSRRYLSICLLAFLALTTVTTEARLRGQASSPSEAARRDRERLKAELCFPRNHELCGEGEGILVCEYDERHSFYSTRCVKKTLFEKHVGLHPKNYCGACHRCFQNTDELQSAVQKYVANATEHTNVARIYGWPMALWCVDAVSDLSHLFSGQSYFNEDIGGWDVSRVTTMESMFRDAYQFDQDLSEWNVGMVTDMSLMFDRAYSFQGHGLADWDTSQVTSFQRMFRIAKNFQEDISLWDVSTATDLSLMFYRAELFNQPVDDWNVERVRDLSYMFAFAKHFDQSVANWQTSAATTTRGMFQSADSFVQDLSGWDVSQVTDTSFMFSNALAFDKTIDRKELLEAWDLKSVEYKEQMFGFIGSVFNQTTSVLSDLRRRGSSSY